MTTNTINTIALKIRAFLMAAVMLCSGVSLAAANDAPLSDIAKIPDTALVMVTSPSCPWCDAFEEEVGHIYGQTPESVQFPLHRIDYFTKFTASLSGIKSADVTPTFIVIRGYEEIGRIEGYPGDEMFWWRFSEYTAE